MAALEAGAVMTNETSTCCGVFVAPGAEMIMGAVYTFVRSPVGFTVTVTASFCPAVSTPEVGLRFIHEVEPLALQLNVPCPGFVIVKGSHVEFVNPWVMVNDREDGLAPILATGDGGVGGGGVGDVGVGVGGAGVVGVTSCNSRCMNPLKPPPFWGSSAFAHCGLKKDRQQSTKHKRESFVSF
ncbi:MAG TPA: hypothetical protein VE177_03360 [Candidatus Binatus sp.]|nr:hypothetical protein [Candidatus Binatus sp.]